jgi:Beta-lactamase class C and other penicillin binding proteins
MLGASVAVIRDGKVLLAKGYGLANVEPKTPASAETVYEIASLTKQFTATAVMLLIEEGKVSLDAPAAKYQPDIPEKWRAVTVRQLLNQTSGIKNYTALPALAADKEYTPKEIIEAVAAEPLEFTPGSAWRYSNTNYFLLGLLIEKVSGASYGEFLKKEFSNRSACATAVSTTVRRI